MLARTARAAASGLRASRRRPAAAACPHRCRSVVAAAEPELTVDDRAGGVRVLTMNRPKANALGRTLLSQLRAALEEAVHDKAARCVILRSS